MEKGGVYRCEKFQTSDQLVLTPSQLKVMENKYLKGDTPEKWLRGVAHNIALAEVLYSGISYEKLCEGVHYEKLVYNVGSEVDVSTLLLHKKGSTDSERSENFKKFLSRLELLAENYSFVKNAENEFYWLLSNFYFLPNSPTLMNAGRKLQQLSACYVLPVEDSIEGWMNTAKDAALIHKSGGGTGFAVSRVRPTGDYVHSTRGIASGPLSPLKIINVVTEEIKQGGQRRGANMGILYYKHPNIEEFIRLKGDNPGALENFNVSVALDEEFFHAMREGKDIELINPKDGKIVGKKNAKKLFDVIVEYAWKSGDPGYVVIDRINHSTSNPTPKLGQIESTNPCGEQPLLPYEPCNLGSINLSKMVKDRKIDYSLLENVIRTSTWFLDDVIDVNNYPLPEIEEIAKGNRRIGLGVMGWAEMLVKLGLPYDSSEARKTAEEIMNFVNTKSLQTSEELAKKRGVFPQYKDSIYDQNGPYFKGTLAKPRNCARTTIAPTGTIALAAGLKGSGIEPFYRICYVRMQAEAVDAVKKGLKPDPKFVYREAVPEFLEVAEKNHWFGLDKDTLIDKIDANGGSVKGMKEIPESIQMLFQCASDLDYKVHIDMQTVFQKHTDNAVSKTINMPQSATVEDIAAAYIYAYEQGVKGLTVYRDKSKSVQVLASPENNLEQKVEQSNTRKRPDSLVSVECKVPTPFGNVYVEYGFDDRGMREVFVKIGKAGSDVSALAEALGRTISLGLKYNVPPEEFVEQLKGIGGSSSIGFGKERVLSIPDAVAKKMIEVLEHEQPVLVEVYKKLYLIKNDTSPLEDTQKKTTESVDLCPECHQATLHKAEGCEQCPCGYSRC